MPEAVSKGHPSAVGLLPHQHGLSGEVKAAGCNPAPGGHGLDQGADHAISDQAETEPHLVM